MKDRIYIIHDVNTKRDPKIILLTQKYGLEGYGIFWALLEYMREDEDIKIRIMSRNAIAYDLHIEEEKLAKVIDFCVEILLFQQDENSFWSPRLLRDVEWMREKKDKARQSAMVRWGTKVSDKNANAMRTHTKSDANAMLNKIKENKKEVSEGDKSPALPPKGNGSLTPAEEMRAFCQDAQKQQKVVDYLLGHGFSQETAKNELTKFIDYWTEQTKSGRLQRWETEKTFEVKKRLSTWIKKYEQYNTK